MLHAVSPWSVLCLHVITLVHCLCAEYKFSPEEYAERTNYSSPFTVFQRCHNDWGSLKKHNTYLLSCEIA